MGRRSKLTSDQWAEAERAHLSGEGYRALARRFKVSEATIRDNLSKRCEEIKTVAEQIVKTEARLRSLPITSQMTALNLADELKVISSQLTGAARLGSMTANRLAAIAQAKAANLDIGTALETDTDALRGIIAMTQGANEAAKTGLALLAANKSGAVIQPDDDKKSNNRPIQFV